MYFTSLPDHSKPGFDEIGHFDRFKKHNIIFNAWGSGSHCDDHVGCLSFKTVLAGEEWYGVNNRRLAVRPGQFLILNDAQNYSCRIKPGQSARTFSIFFKHELAAQVFHDAHSTAEAALDDPFGSAGVLPEFFQTLTTIDSGLQSQLMTLIHALETSGYDKDQIETHLAPFLHHLIQIQRKETNKMVDVSAAKSSTQREVFRRLCLAKDYLHSYYLEKPELDVISRAACLSVPQLIRQFKSVFKTTPHQYLVQLRLNHARALLKNSEHTVQEISWQCGFDNASAFGRAFKAMYGCQPGQFRTNSKVCHDTPT